MSNKLRSFFKITFLVSVVLLLIILVLPLWFEFIDSEFILKLIATILAVNIIVGIAVAIFSSNKNTN